jgi:hypothetical protein
MKLLSITMLVALTNQIQIWPSSTILEEDDEPIKFLVDKQNENFESLAASVQHISEKNFEF